MTKFQLELPAFHELSLLLCTQRTEAQKTLDREIFTIDELSPGLLQVTVTPKDSEDYGDCCYECISVGRNEKVGIPVYIGGAGTGLDYKYSSSSSSSINGNSNGNSSTAFLEQMRTPVLIRIAVPISHACCDDGGVVKDVFWSVFNCDDGGSSNNKDNKSTSKHYDEHGGRSIDINLVNICHRIFEMFRGPLVAHDIDEVEEWKSICMFNKKKQDIVHRYMQLYKHTGLFWGHGQKKFPTSFCAPNLRNILEDPSAADVNIKWKNLLRAECDGVYSFDLFNPDFCQMLIEEIDNYEATSLPSRRPNTMNKSGLILNDIGLEGLMTSLLQCIISPISRVCFAKEVFASNLDHHHSFVVEYSASTVEKDKFLDMHHDSSEITLNVCLGREFTGSGLKFCGQFGATSHRSLKYNYEHVVGRGIIHLGRHRHGADTILQGDRMNLIVWARSSCFRNAAGYGFIDPDGYPKEIENLDFVDQACLSATNDDDYETLLNSRTALIS